MLSLLIIVFDLQISLDKQRYRSLRELGLSLCLDLYKDKTLECLSIPLLTIPFVMN
jgi:hypothetical protein